MCRFLLDSFVYGYKEPPRKPQIISLIVIVSCIVFVWPDFLITLLTI
jgi:hypothetical protein